MGNQRRGSQLMTGITCALAGSGGSPYNGSTTVTVGYLSSGGFTSYGFNQVIQGSITPTTWASSALPVTVLKFIDYPAGPLQWIEFRVTGSAPNSGWETMDVAGGVLNRASASYTNSGTETYWIWFGVPNYFGFSIGATKVVTWA
jgi:hypothetical protein